MRTITPDERAAALELLTQVRERWLVANQIEDSTLHPVVRLALSGLWVLAWVIQPDTTDSPVALCLLTFLRFVPIFIVGGSLYGRAGTGALIGLGLFFALMAAESLSIVIWDANLFESSAKLGTLSNLLYLDGLIGILLCGAAMLAMRQGKLLVPNRFLRLSMQVLVAIQLALVIELAYTGFQSAVGTDRQNAGVVETLTMSNHDSSSQP